MDIPIALTNTNMTQQRVIILSSSYLDGAEVDVVLQGDSAGQKSKIAERLEQLVAQDPGNKSSFSTALNAWLKDFSMTVPLIAGKHTLKLSIKYNHDMPAEFSGHVTLNLYAVPSRPAPAVMVESGMVLSRAVDELGAITPAMKQSLKMVFNKTATGRSAPGTTNVNHIHVGGNAQQNLLFLIQPGLKPYIVLGLVDGHMDKSAPPSIKAKAQQVTARSANAAAEAKPYRIVGTALVNP